MPIRIRVKRPEERFLISIVLEKYGLKALPIQNDSVLIKPEESTIQSRLHLGFAQCSSRQICTKDGFSEADELKENIGQYWSPRRKHIQGVKN